MNCTIGGTTPGAGNVIAASVDVGTGIYIGAGGVLGIGFDYVPATGNLVEGNWIGTNPSGVRTWGMQEPASHWARMP